MESKDLHPSTLAGIKKLASVIGRERGIPHHDALEAAAKQAGYQNIRHARRVLAQPSPSAPPAQEHAPARPGAPLPVAATAPAPEPMPASPPPSQVTTPPAPAVAGRFQRSPFNASAHAANLREQIRSDENTLRAIRGGRITGMGYEVGPHNARAAYEADQAMGDGHLAGVDYNITFNSAASVAAEMQRLEQRVEQNRALLRMDEAKESAAGHR